MEVAFSARVLRGEGLRAQEAPSFNRENDVSSSLRFFFLMKSGCVPAVGFSSAWVFSSE